MESSSKVIKVGFTEPASLSPTCTSGGGKESGLAEADRERQTVTCTGDRLTKRPTGQAPAQQ